MKAKSGKQKTENKVAEAAPTYPTEAMKAVLPMVPLVPGAPASQPVPPPTGQGVTFKPAELHTLDGREIGHCGGTDGCRWFEGTAPDFKQGPCHESPLGLIQHRSYWCSKWVAKQWVTVLAKPE